MRSSRRNTTIAFVTLFLLITSCTRSASISHDDLVATMVAGTLSALPSARASFTPAPETATSDSATSTDQPTATSTVTATASPTASPTAGPSDPRSGLDLNNPGYRDDFSVPGRWYGGLDDAEARLAYEGEAFAAIDKLTNFIIFYTTSVRTESNFYAEIDARIQACAGRDSGGIAVRVSGASYDKAYVFEVACNGEYRLRKFIDFATSPATLLGWTYTDAIHKGPNVTNRIGIYAEDDEIYLFVNGTLLTQNPIEDNDYTDGRFGLFASAVQTPNLKVVFDNFALWTLAP